MVKNKQSNFSYELIFICIIIIVAIILLFIFVKPETKQIYELKNKENGKYLISGFVSNLEISENYTKFKIADSTDSIIVYSYHKFTDINNNQKMDLICNLQSTKYGKQCLID